MPPLTTLEKKDQGSRPHMSHRAKTSRPEGSPGSGWTLMMKRKTKE